MITMNSISMFTSTSSMNHISTPAHMILLLLVVSLVLLLVLFILRLLLLDSVISTTTSIFILLLLVLCFLSRLRGQVRVLVEALDADEVDLQRVDQLEPALEHLHRQAQVEDAEGEAARLQVLGRQHAGERHERQHEGEEHRRADPAPL